MSNYGDTLVASAAIQKICDQVKEDAEKHTDNKYEIFKANLFRTQTANGTNYIIKVHVGDDHYIHLRVNVSLGGEINLSGVQEKHSEDSHIEKF